MNISTLTTGLILSASLLMFGCSVNGIANSSVSLDSNEAKTTVKKTIKISDFDEIEASQGIKIILVQGTNNGTAAISTTESAEKYLKVEVRNNTLKAYYSNSGIQNVSIKGPSIIRLTCPDLKEVNLSSLANLTIEGEFKSNGEMEVDLSSSASFNAGKITCQ